MCWHGRKAATKSWLHVQRPLRTILIPAPPERAHNWQAHTGVALALLRRASVTEEMPKQATVRAGRLIRHAHDYGAVLLVDCRFSMTRYKAMLSPWLKAKLTTATIDSNSAQLHSFFQQKSQQQRQLFK